MDMLLSRGRLRKCINSKNQSRKNYHKRRNKFSRKKKKNQNKNKTLKNLTSKEKDRFIGKEDI